MHRAPIDNPVMPDGFRSGRFESTAANFEGYRQAHKFGPGFPDQKAAPEVLARAIANAEAEPKQVDPSDLAETQAFPKEDEDAIEVLSEFDVDTYSWAEPYHGNAATFRKDAAQMDFDALGNRLAALDDKTRKMFIGYLTASPGTHALGKSLQYDLFAGLTDYQQRRHQLGHAYDNEADAQQQADAWVGHYQSIYERLLGEPPSDVPDVLVRVVQQPDGKWVQIKLKSAWRRMKDAMQQLNEGLGEKGAIEGPEFFSKILKAVRDGFAEWDERISEGLENGLRRALGGGGDSGEPPHGGGGGPPPVQPPDPGFPEGYPDGPWESRVPKEKYTPIPPPKAAKLNRNFLSRFNPEMRPHLENMVDEIEDRLIKDKRDRQPFARQAANGERVVIDLEKVKKSGRPITAEEAWAYHSTIGGLLDDLNVLWKKAIDTPELFTDADMLVARKMYESVEVVSRNLLMGSSENARALGALRTITRLMQTRDKGAITTTAQSLRKQWAAMMKEMEGVEDPVKRLEIMRRHTEYKWYDKLRSYMFGNILSGTPSFFRNITGSVYNIGNEFFADNFAVPMIALAKKLPPEMVARSPLLTKLAKGTMTYDTLPAEWYGLFGGMINGYRDALFVMEHGSNPFTLRSIWDSPDALRPGRYDFQGRTPSWGFLPNAIKDKQFIDPKFHPWNVVGRGLEATDVFFRSMFKHKYLTEHAYDYAVGQVEGRTFTSPGHRDAAIKQGMDHFLSNIGDELEAQAEHYAARNVYQSDPGTFGKWVMKLKKGDPAIMLMVDTFIPFIRTASNILRHALIENGPLGFSKRLNPELAWAIKEGHGNDVARAMSRALIGTLTIPVMWGMAGGGMLVGGTPRNAADREEFFANKKIANSMWTPAGYVTHSMWGPLSIQAATIATMREEWKRRQRSQNVLLPKNERAWDAAVQVAASMGSSVSETSFLQGMQNMANAFQNMASAPGALGSQFESFAFPMSAMVRRGMYAADPTVRKAESFKEGAQMYIPGLAQANVSPRIDRYGQVVQRGGNALSRFASPFDVQSAQPSKLTQELSKLNISMGTPSSTATIFGQKSTPLPTEIRASVQKRRGQAATQAMEAVINHPDYDGWSNYMKATALYRARQTALREVNESLKAPLHRYMLERYKKNADQSFWRYALFGEEK